MIAVLAALVISVGVTSIIGAAVTAAALNTLYGDSAKEKGTKKKTKKKK